LRANAWLGAAGALLAGGCLVLGPDGLVACLAAVSARAPAGWFGFEEIKARQVRFLQPLICGLGLLAVAACGVASRRGVDVWRWLLGTALAAPASGREWWRTSAIAVAVGYSLLLVPVRIVRDVVREDNFRGMSFEERRIQPYGFQSRDFDRAAALVRATGGRGDIVVVRPGGQILVGDALVAALLFPQRVFVSPGPRCDPDQVAAVRSERPQARWVVWACEDEDVLPVPLSGEPR